MMKLFIDIGNQRLKWASCKQLNQLHQPSVQTQMASQVCASQPMKISAFIDVMQQQHSLYDEVWVSRVGNQETEQIIEDFFSQETSIRYQRVTTQKQFAQLVNDYEQVESLGVDRWLCAIAATQLSNTRPLLVVDAGTAMTIDYIDQQTVYRGGIIVPGLTTMLRCLMDETKITITADIMTRQATTIDASAVQFNNTCTEDALINGTKIMLISTLDAAIKTHREQSVATGVMVTGGDGQLLVNHCQYQGVTFHPYLVLQGLSFVAAKNNFAKTNPA